MHRELGWHKLPRISNDIGEEVTLRIERPAAVTEAVETDLQQFIGTALAQFKRPTALDDGE